MTSFSARPCQKDLFRQVFDEFTPWLYAPDLCEMINAPQQGFKMTIFAWSSFVTIIIDCTQVRKG